MELCRSELDAVEASGIDVAGSLAVCRFRWKYHTYASTKYTRPGKSDSSVVQFSLVEVAGRYASENMSFGRITTVIVKENQLFCTLALIHLTGETITKVCAGPRDEILDQILALCDYGKHFRVAEETEEFVCIKAEQIVGHGLLLPFGCRNKTFVTAMPLHYEHS